MPFSERLKLEVKRKADFTCCWCRDHRNKVDVHHIVPQALDGADTLDNAAPLCGSCHDLYGNNPDLRKEIRSRRDHWYERCATERKPPARSIQATITSTSKLPATAQLFVGRDDELAQLDSAWEDPLTSVITLVAEGGAGKSALVNCWLDLLRQDRWRSADHVFGWSFYSQGTDTTQASGDAFVDEALQEFGYYGEPIISPWKKGQTLARLIARRRTLLILDGLEPLQQSDAQMGKLKDPSVAALLRELQAQNPGLCVITTRVSVADIAGRAGVEEIDVEQLPTQTGAALLKQLGVKGKETELEEAATEFGGHALALTLLGTYLRDVCDGDVRRRKEVKLLDDGIEKGQHARNVMAAYAKWLGDGPEIRILRLLGLFDRPAEGKAVAALRAAPPIPNLTEGIAIGDEKPWRLALARLVKARLVVDDRTGGLDAHPLVREYWSERLRNDAPAAWQEGNKRLYAHYRNVAPDRPETLEQMQPLYTAVVHGCRAGRVQQAFKEAYVPRILRGNEFFSTSKLGAFGSELTALDAFFYHSWSQPSPQLAPPDQAWILNAAGFVLRALGRLPEAVEPMRASMEADILNEEWKGAAISAGNLSEMTLTLGDVLPAVVAGQKSVELADCSQDAFMRLAARAILADALHQAGRREESAVWYRQAEAIQEEWQPYYPRLYSLQGYRYCDLLLSRGEPTNGSGFELSSRKRKRNGVLTPAAMRYRKACEEVQKRVTTIFEWRKLPRWNLSLDPLLDISLDHLTLGRAYLGLALTSPDADYSIAVEYLNRSVDILRQGSREDYLPRVYIARAALNRLRGDLTAAVADLTEAEEIAERGHMLLHQADAYLEWVRLHLQRGESELARERLDQARELVAATGYGRREREVRWLTGRVAEM